MRVTLYMDCFATGRGIVAEEWEFLDGKTIHYGGLPWLQWHCNGSRWYAPSLDDVLAEGRWVATRDEAVKRYRAAAKAAKQRAERALADPLCT